MKMPVTKVLFALCITAAAAMAQSSLTCSSDDMLRHYCSADTSRGVQMVHQRSDAACIQGRTWGYDRRGIWVDRGCRADFQVGLNGYGRNNGGYQNNGRYGREDGYGRNDPYSNGRYSTGSTTCSSDDMRRHYCSVDTSGGVRLLRQRSDASCIQGRTWGYDRRGIWVDRGCRADFEIGAGGNRNQNGRNDNGYGRGGWRPWD